MRKFALLAAVLALAACDKSKPELEKQLVRVQQISAEKDSLLKDVMQTSQFIADVNTELAKVKSSASGKPVQGKPGEMESSLTPTQQRDAIKAKIQEITDRLTATEARLGASRKRIADLGVQVATYDSTIVAFRSIIENQKTEIAALTAQVNALTAENTTLKQEKATLTTEKTQLTEQKATLTVERNTVYYVVGTKEELIAKGVIEQTGGLLGIGKTQVPKRDLSPTEFTSVDKTKVSEVSFPKADKNYKIISRQDVSALEAGPDAKGRIKGGLKIKDADKFWAASKYLVVLEQ